MRRVTAFPILSVLVVCGLTLARPAPSSAQQGWVIAPSSLSPVNIEGGGADVAFTGPGQGLAVWTQFDGSLRTVLLARHDPATNAWRIPADQLSPTGRDAFSPRVAIDGAGNAIVVWVREDAGLFALEAVRYTAATGLWSAPAPIATIGPGGAGPDLAMTPGGDAHVVWTAISAVTPLVITVQGARYVASTGQWTAAAPLSTPGDQAYFARVAVTPGGDAVAAWSVEASETTEIVEAARFTAATSTWSAPETLSAPGSYAEDVRVALDPAGNAVVVWQRVAAIEAARYDAMGAAWSAAQVLSTGAFSDGPAIVSDLAGNATAIWRRTTGSVETTRFDATLAAWQPAVTMPDAAAVGAPALAVDAAGNVVAFWPGGAPGAGSAQGARYVRATGQWSTVQTIATSGTPDLVDMAADNAGTVHVVWNNTLMISSVFTTRWSGAPRAPVVTGVTRAGPEVRVGVTPPPTTEPAFAATAYEYSLSTRPWVRVPLASPIVLPTPMVGSWYLAVRAVNHAGAGAEAGVVFQVPPEAPTQLAVMAVSGSRVTLGWQVPPGATSDTTYLVEGGVLPGQVLASLPTGSPSPTFTFDAPTGRFFVRIRATMWGLQSAPSNEVVLAVNAAVPPSAPANLLGLVDGSTLALSWTTTFAGGPPTDALLAVQGPVSGTVPLGNADTFHYANVPPGTYTFRVIATNAQGASPPSAPVTLTFPGACSGVPGVPPRFVVERSGRTLSLAWSPPESGGAATAYLLTVSGAFAGVFPLTGRTIAAPVGPGAYTFELRAANPCGASAPTDAVTVVVP